MTPIDGSALHGLVRKTLPLVFGMIFSVPVSAFDYDLRGYLGYALADSDEDFQCTNRACQGVFDDSLFYGLSAAAQGEHIGAQLIISQDVDEDPDISLAQATYRNQLFGQDMNLRAGKIIVPLGLYGSQRITPTTQPGLPFPQSFLLNAYYDLITLSEEGLGLDYRGDQWGFKAAVYEPEEQSVERVVLSPAAGPLDFLLVGLLGIDALSGLGGGAPQTMTVVEKQRNKAAYLGMDYRDVEYQVDLGWVTQELGDVNIDAYNGGFLIKVGNFQPSLEAFELDVRELDTTIEGICLNFVYSFEKWQLFTTGVHMDIGRNEAQELVVGGVYYWLQGDLSTRLTLRRLDGDLPGATQGLDQTDAVGLAIAYSWD